jgi:hypothetical protein
MRTGQHCDYFRGFDHSLHSMWALKENLEWEQKRWLFMGMMSVMHMRYDKHDAWFCIGRQTFNRTVYP